MEDGFTSIGAMCKEFDVTARTLRFYEAKELIFPKRDGQRRLFSRRDRARLKLILRGKRFGFSLEEIRQLLNLYDLDDQGETQLLAVFQAAQDRYAAMVQQRDELNEAITDLAANLEWAAQRLRERGVTTAAE